MLQQGMQGYGRTEAEGRAGGGRPRRYTPWAPAAGGLGCPGPTHPPGRGSLRGLPASALSRRGSTSPRRPPRPDSTQPPSRFVSPAITPFIKKHSLVRAGGLKGRGSRSLSGLSFPHLPLPSLSALSSRCEHRPHPPHTWTTENVTRCGGSRRVHPHSCLPSPSSSPEVGRTALLGARGGASGGKKAASCSTPWQFCGKV